MELVKKYLTDDSTISSVSAGNIGVSETSSQTDWGSGQTDWGSNNSLLDGMDSSSGVDDLGLESVDGVSDVVDGTEDTIGLDKRVRSLDDSSVTGFGGGLLVSGVFVSNSVVVGVSWVGIDISGNNWGSGVTDSWANDSSGGDSGASQSEDNLDGNHDDCLKGFGLES